jgi:hypothetical protein
MIPLTLKDTQILVAGSVFLLGCLCVIIGALVLLSRGYSREVRELAVHTARLGQKGMAQEVSTLVGQAAELVRAINELIRTASGISVFLITLGIGMIVAAYWVIMQIDWAIA